MTSIPVLETERLTLRAHTMGDFQAYAAFCASDRSRYMGGPFAVTKAWNWFCNDTAQWALLDMGGLLIDRRDTGETIGQVSLCHGPIFPEPELGWFLFDGHEGHGFAVEAATALRGWAYGKRGLTTLVSYIDIENARSIAVAERLGATRDPAAALPEGDLPSDTYVFRHPGPQVLQ